MAALGFGGTGSPGPSFSGCVAIDSRSGQTSALLFTAMSKAPEKPDKNSELGTLIVVLLKARNLNDKYSFRKQDVFAQASLNNVQKRTHVDLRGGQHPEWDSEVRFTVLKENGPGGKNRKLEVSCYCQGPKTEDLLGGATVDISDTLKTGEFDDWVSLNVDGIVRGDIYLEMTYYANAPAPAAPKNKLLAPVQGSALGRRPSKLSPSDRLSRPIQQNFSPKQPSQLQDRINNPTPSPLNNAVPPAKRNSSLLALLMDEPVHANTLPNTRNRRSPSPQAIQLQPAQLPSILRPGLGGYPSSAPASDPRDFGHNRSSSDSSNNRPHGIGPVASLPQLNPYIGGSSAYAPAHTELSNNVGTSSNPYTGGSGAYIIDQQASGRRGYSPAPPGAFIPGNQPPPDGRSYSPASRVASPNPYTGGGGFMPGNQQQQVSGGRGYSPVQSTMSMQVSGSLHPSVPIAISPRNPYTGNGGLHLPESQQGPNVPSYPPATSPVQTSNYSAPTNPYTGGNAAFIPGSQSAPDERAYSSAPPVDTSQTLRYANHSIPLQVPNGPYLPYNNVSTEASGGVSSGPFAFPTPMVPIVVEPYGYHEPSLYKSSHHQPLLSTRRNSVDNNQRSERELDPHQLARYQTPLPLPPGFIKESPLPPLPPPPTIATPSPVSTSPPEVVVPAPVPDTTRVEALRKVEQAAAWRKEQELKDLELAMQLDRELNLD